MTFQFTDKLPNVDSGAIGQYIANGVAGNGIVIISHQQIATCTILGIVDNALNRTQRCGSIGKVLFAQNIDCIVISPEPDFVRRLVILTR